MTAFRRKPTERRGGVKGFRKSKKLPNSSNRRKFFSDSSPHGGGETNRRGGKAHCEEEDLKNA